MCRRRPSFSFSFVTDRFDRVNVYVRKSAREQVPESWPRLVVVRRFVVRFGGVA
ncbi:hypothetical protein HSB1_22720 [Halogranum salarium B-1]|uniref:Uncharacterized protein n=1 Tax=Halogranum salarium B-1 TaxID=1210908 RepID=J3JF25_9EURY|nr:hypothetical protein HSB1_22720 [Halogranum salarium B-1]